jgi:O-antigen/teichoic acid export membrane protein
MLAGLVIATRALTEVLEPGVFGTVQLLLGAVSFGSNVLNLALMEAGLRFYADVKSQLDGIHRLRAVLNRGLLWTNALLAALVFLGGRWFYEGMITWLICALLTGLLAVGTLSSLEMILQNAARRQAPVALWGLADTWVRPFVALGLVVLIAPYPVIVLLGYFLGALLVLAVFVYLTRPEGSRTAIALPGDDGALSRQIWEYAYPLMPLGAFLWIAAMSDRYLVGGMLGTAEAGVYIAAATLATRPMSIGLQIVETTLRPHYYEALARGDEQAAGRFFRLWLGLLAAGAGTMTLLAFSASDWIVGLLLGPDYVAAARLLPWLTLGGMLWVFGLTYQRRLYALKQTTTLLRLRAVTVPISLASIALLTYGSGARGAAIAWSVCNGLELLVFVIHAHGPRRRETAALSLTQQDALEHEIS